MRNLIICAVYMLILQSACKGPVNVDWEIAPGKVIGQEPCNKDSKLNAWLIVLSPDQQKVYGSDIVFQGKQYNNVVKTYNLDAQAIDLTKNYIFWFYLENTTAQPVCDLSTPNVYNIPQIKIKDVSLKGN